MTRNSVSVRQLAREVLQALRSSFDGTYEAAKTIARVYESISRDNGEREYDNQEIRDFFDELAKLGIGQGADFLRENKSGGLSKSGSATTYAKFAAIGTSELFLDAEIRKACLISGYNSLYALTMLFEDYVAEYAGGSKAQREDGARKKVLKLLADRGADLTRAEINAYRNAIATDNEDDPGKTKRKFAAGSTTLSDLVSLKKRYDFLFLTPTSKFLTKVQDTPFNEIEEVLPLASLRSDKSDWMLTVEGSDIEAGLRLLHLFGDAKPKTVACIIDQSAKGRFIDITKQTVVFASKAIPSDLRLRSDGGSMEIAGAISAKAERRLHLFADDVTDGWDTCIGDESSVSRL